MSGHPRTALRQAHDRRPARPATFRDLFVAKAARGKGTAQTLIEGVAEIARSRDATRLYWTTQEDDARARLLYGKVAWFNGFIRYDYPL